MKTFYHLSLTLFLCAFNFLVVAQTRPLALNEIMSSNTNTVADADGSFEDWIELYNSTDEPINLTGYYLSDNASQPLKWEFPEVSIAPKAFLLVWASDKMSTSSALHANFKISKEGEPILLSNASGEVIDQAPAVALADNQVLARMPDGSGEWQVSTVATPGSPNIATELVTAKGVATMSINTQGVPIDDKETKIEGALEMLNGENSNFPETGLYSGKVGIRGRGNSSWSMPKKSYSVEIWNEANEGVEAPLLDMPAGEDWALIANYADKSLMRNYIAYGLSSSMGHYAPRAQFTDFYLNDEYQGNYLLVERIKRGKNRVDVKKLSASEEHQEEPAISGGYILELTPRITQSKAFTTPQLGSAGKAFEFVYPTHENVTPAQATWISNYMQEFEDVLYSDNFANPTEGYAKYIDIDSFIDYIIVNEIAKNADAAMHASVFLVKDRNGKLKPGPVWDFDIAFGNINYTDNWNPENWYLTESLWLKRLFEDSRFTNRFVARMQEVRPLLDALPAHIDETADLLRTSADRNFQRWDILGHYVWPNHAPYPDSYQGEVDRLKEWVVARTNWVYDNLGTLLEADYPAAHLLSCQDYTLTEWEASSEAGTYPANMVLEQTQQQDPGLATEMDGLWTMPYNLTSRSRINGIGEQGISFVNTGNAQDTPEAGYVGTAVLSLNTTNLTNITVTWTDSTINPNNRHYGLRMQYRVGATGAYADVLDAEGAPVEYLRNATAGHSQQFENITLPAQAENEPLVQVRWKFYFIPTSATGNRAELRLDDILVAGTPVINTIATAMICRDEPATLTVAAQPGATVMWMRDGEEIAGEASNILQASVAGNYTATVRMGESCSYTTVPLAVDVAEAPARPTIIATDDNLLTVAAVTEGASYIWTRDNETLENNTALLEPTGSGTYTVQVVNNASSCTSEISESYVLTITALPAFAASEKFEVFPNPSTGELNLVTQAGMANATVSIVDITGKEIFRKSTIQAASNYTFDLASKPKGIYFMKVLSDKQQLTKKIILQ